jgi:hypothetical protein
MNSKVLRALIIYLGHFTRAKQNEKMKKEVHFKKPKERNYYLHSAEMEKEPLKN